MVPYLDANNGFTVASLAGGEGGRVVVASQGLRKQRGFMSVLRQYWGSGYPEITHNPLLFSVAQGIFWQSKETCTLVLCIVLQLWRPASTGADSDKILEGRTSTYTLHLSGGYHTEVQQELVSCIEALSDLQGRVGLNIVLLLV